MKSFYECSLFQDDLFEVKTNFEVKQNELLLEASLSNDSYKFKKLNVLYSCEWTQQENWSSEKPTILLPIKDNNKLLNITMLNFKKFNVGKYCNVIIIDDRSTEDIKTTALENSFSYLRVDNDKGFNFSMLNNIAAKICEKLGNHTVILWNSDLWCVKEEWLLKVLDFHKNNKNTVTGTKLLYPPKEMSINGDLDTPNILKNFPHMDNGRWRETVQFGGDAWIRVSKSNLLMSPIHHRRFSDKNDKRVDCNRGCSFVTGAFQIWDLSGLIELGGLNPTLSKNFQDVDICLRLLENNIQSVFCGEDVYFYHDESPILEHEGKQDNQLISDHIIFGKLWNNKLANLVL